MLRLFLVIMLTFGAHSTSWGQLSLRGLEEAYVQEQNQSSGIFESIPLSHFSPAFNVVTFAGEVNYLDVTATESEKSQYVDNSLTSRITGYQIEPYVALSLKSFGLGLTGEAGNYVTSYTGYESTPGSSYRINYNISRKRMVGCQWQ